MQLLRESAPKFSVGVDRVNRLSAQLAAHPWQTSTGTRPCGVAGVSRNQPYPLLPLLALSGLDATSRASESPHEREW